MRLRDILSELEGRVEPLRLQAEKAEQFIALDKEKKGLEIGIWLETLDRSGRVLREHGEKISLAQAQHVELEEEIQSIAQRTEENLRKVNQCTVGMEEARAQAAALDEQAVRAEGEASLLENDAAHNRENLHRLEGQVEEASRSGQDVDQEISGKREEMAQKERQIQESRDRLLAFTQRLEELRQGADEATRQMEQAAVELAQYNASLAEQRIALSSTQTSVVEIRHRAWGCGGERAPGPGTPGLCPAEGQGTGGAAPGGGDGCLRPGERGQGLRNAFGEPPQAGPAGQGGLG